MFILFQGEYYGVDWDGPAPNVHLADESTIVEVPTTRNPLEPAQQSLLINLINPLRDSDEYGVDIFLEVLTFIQQTTNIWRFASKEENTGMHIVFDLTE